MKMKKNIAIIQIVFVIMTMQQLFSSPVDSLHSIVDTILIPSADLYQHTWGGDNTRLRTNLLDRQGNYCLPLQIETESNFVFPCVNNSFVCSPYGMRSGRMHTGMDIKQKLGDSIVAAWDGVVRMAKKNYYAYGGTVVIRHGNGLETLYAHLSSIDVKENQAVKAGELIGKAGRTGRATTEHLHFETRFLYEHFDPRTIIDFHTFSLCADTLYVQKGKFKTNGAILIENNVIQLDSNIIAVDSNQMDTSLEEEIATKIVLKQKEITTIENNKNPFFIVKKGDTLYSISRKYNMSVQDLCKLNNLKENSILSVGQKLKLE
jgi:LysM repeat protein